MHSRQTNKDNIQDAHKVAPQASGRDPKGEGFINEADNSSIESTRTGSLAKGEDHEKEGDVETKEINNDTEKTTKERKNETNVAAEQVEENVSRADDLSVSNVGRKKGIICKGSFETIELRDAIHPLDGNEQRIVDNQVEHQFNKILNDEKQKEISEGYVRSNKTGWFQGQSLAIDEGHLEGQCQGNSEGQSVEGQENQSNFGNGNNVRTVTKTLEKNKNKTIQEKHLVSEKKSIDGTPKVGVTFKDEVHVISTAADPIQGNLDSDDSGDDDEIEMIYSREDETVGDDLAKSNINSVTMEINCENRIDHAGRDSEDVMYNDNNMIYHDHIDSQVNEVGENQDVGTVDSHSHVNKVDDENQGVGTVDSQMSEVDDGNQGPRTVDPQINDVNDGSQESGTVDSQRNDDDDENWGLGTVNSQVNKVVDKNEGSETVVSQVNEVDDKNEGGETVVSQVNELSNENQGGETVDSQVNEVDENQGGGTVDSQVNKVDNENQDDGTIDSEVNKVDDENQGVVVVDSQMNKIDDGNQGPRTIDSQVMEVNNENQGGEIIDLQVNKVDAENRSVGTVDLQLNKVDDGNQGLGTVGPQVSEVADKNQEGVTVDSQRNDDDDENRGLGTVNSQVNKAVGKNEGGKTVDSQVNEANDENQGGDTVDLQVNEIVKESQSGETINTGESAEEKDVENNEIHKNSVECENENDLISHENNSEIRREQNDQNLDIFGFQKNDKYQYKTTNKEGVGETDEFKNGEDKANNENQNTNEGNGENTIEITNENCGKNEILREKDEITNEEISENKDQITNKDINENKVEINDEDKYELTDENKDEITKHDINESKNEIIITGNDHENHDGLGGEDNEDSLENKGENKGKSEKIEATNEPHFDGKNQRYSFPEVLYEILNKHKTEVETNEKSIRHEVSNDEEIDEMVNGEEIDEVHFDGKNQRYSFPEVVCEVLNKHKIQVETDAKSIVHEVTNGEEIDEMVNGREIDDVANNKEIGDVANDEEIDEVASDLLEIINEPDCGEKSCLSMKPRLSSIPTLAVVTPPKKIQKHF